ncbi:MAG: protoporphyrinogen oxidase, partial [Chloroflexi bacterium]|nr:protoporphyrinogen oxidase [Chloroflexota bacterium]
IDIEQKYGSLTRGMIAARKARAAASKSNGQSATGKSTTVFMTLRNGLQELVTALRDALRGDVITGCGVSSIQPQGNGYTLTLDDGRQLEADAVVLATPAFVSADLLRAQHPELAAMLDAIRYVSTATVSLGFDATDFDHPLNGFGFVVPRKEPTRLLACTWTSTKFTHRAGPNTVLLRAFIGGPRREEFVGLDDDALISLVREELHAIMGISAAPTVARAYRWQRGNPQYDVGHLERVDQMEALAPPGVFLTGSAFRGVGIPDCVKQGRVIAEQAAAYIGQHVPAEA